MHNLIFDPAKLTDDQILEKLGKAYQYLSFQENLGHDSAVASITQTIIALDNERISRFQDSIEADIAHTNPNLLDPIELGTIENEQDTDS